MNNIIWKITDYKLQISDVDQVESGLAVFIVLGGIFSFYTACRVTHLSLVTINYLLSAPRIPLHKPIPDPGSTHEDFFSRRVLWRRPKNTERKEIVPSLLRNDTVNFGAIH